MRIILLLFCFLANNLFAQEAKTGNWLIYFGNQPINKKINFWNEVQYRNYNTLGDLQQFLLRTGLGYNLTPQNNNILLGYGFIHGENYINQTQKKASFEHRIFQQFTTKQNILNSLLTHRYRIEQRFIETQFNVRFRYFLSLNIPLNQPELKKKTIYLSAYNEIFIQGSTSFFDRNRLYGALGYFINDHIKLELGFMNQTTNVNSRNQFQIVLFNQIPFRKTK
jgi:hypothetical protein